MNEIKISIVYPADILGKKTGGIETFIKGVLKYAPPQYRIKFIGISSDKNRRTGIETEETMSGKPFTFFPLFHEVPPATCHPRA